MDCKWLQGKWLFWENPTAVCLALPPFPEQLLMEAEVGSGVGQGGSCSFLGGAVPKQGRGHCQTCSLEISLQWGSAKRDIFLPRCSSSQSHRMV